MRRATSRLTTGQGDADSEHRPPPPATGVRTEWSALPAALRHLIEQRLGGQVIEAVTQAGGFSPGVAARLRLDNGKRAFVKAVGPEPNPESPHIHRAEARIVAALPESVPAPRSLGSFDEDGWVALLFEDVEGVMPAQPWIPVELDRVLSALADLAVSLTPAPVSAPPVAERFGDSFHGWRHLLRAHQTGEDDLAGLDAWARRHLTTLAELEARWGVAAEGDTLLHADLRADNLLLTDDRVMVVDWPWACVGAPWIDLLSMLPSVRMQGGPPPETLFEDHPVAQGADPHAVTAVLAALTGFFVQNSRLPAPPGLPTLRAFQDAQGRVALEWLRTRTGWE
jgi:aminoglycoside phosphotransferase (APT) family kinase protein